MSGSNFYNMPTSGRMQAEEALAKIREQKAQAILGEQEKFFCSLPAQLRKEVIYRSAEFYLKHDAELVFRNEEVERLVAEENKLDNMLHGGINRRYNSLQEGLAYPYPALVGIAYERLLELDLECEIDKAVT